METAGEGGASGVWLYLALYLMKTGGNVPNGVSLSDLLKR